MKKIKLDIINLEHRADRKIDVLKAINNITDIGSLGYKFYNACYTPGNGSLGCAISHFSVISEFIKSTEFDYQVILEDDIQFNVEFNLKELVMSIDGKFDCFLFTHNTAVIENNIIDNIYRVYNSQTATGYIVSRQFAPVLLRAFAMAINCIAKYSDISNLELVKSMFAIDMVWKPLQIDYVFLTTIPPMAFQRPSFSDIENTHVDYNN